VTPAGFLQRQKQMAINLKNVTPWIITVSALIGIWQYVVPKAKDLLDFRNRVSFEVSKVYDFDFVGGILGNFRFKSDIKVTNPTNADVLLKKPYIKAFINNNYVGETQPSGETKQISPNSSTEIKNIEVKIPLANLGNMLPLFQKLKNNQQTGNTLRLDVLTEVNNMPVETNIEYQI